MYAFYNLVLIILAVIFSPLVLAAFIIQPKLRAGFWEKMGFYKEIFSLSKQSQPYSIWFHAVSVGEVNAVEALVKKAKKEFPDYKIVVSTVTRTGQAVAKIKFKDTADKIIYFPYDFTFSIEAAIKAVNPKLIVIAETEIWPNFCHRAKKHAIPLILVNGRISPNSYKNYSKFKVFFKNVLENFSLILMQTQEDRRRIIDIGADCNKTEVMGNLKYDISNLLDKHEIKELKDSLKVNDRKILIAGSTHKGEDETVINVFKRLKPEIPDLKLIIAPRHPERNDQVLKLISETGFKFGLRSKNSNFKDSDIILLDTMGELSKLYSVATIAFIGGSFSGTGGHNPLESAIYGTPVISGSTVFNFKDIYKFMTENQAAFIVNDECEFSEKVREFICFPEKHDAAKLACLGIFDKNKGALDYAINKISSILNVI